MSRPKRNVTVRREAFPPPLDTDRPDLEWALSVREEWINDGKPELDGPPLDQMKIALGVIYAHQRAIQ